MRLGSGIDTGSGEGGDFGCGVHNGELGPVAGLELVQGAQPGMMGALSEPVQAGRNGHGTDAARKAENDDDDDDVFRMGLDDRGLYSDGGRMLAIAAANADEAMALLDFGESGLSIRDRGEMADSCGDFLGVEPVVLPEDMDGERMAKYAADGSLDRRIRGKVVRMAIDEADNDLDRRAGILLWEDALGHPESLDAIALARGDDKGSLRDAGILDETKSVDNRSFKGGLFAGFAGSADDIADLFDKQVERVLTRGSE